MYINHSAILAQKQRNCQLASYRFAKCLKKYQQQERNFLCILSLTCKTATLKSRGYVSLTHNDTFSHDNYTLCVRKCFFSVSRLYVNETMSELCMPARYRVLENLFIFFETVSVSWRAVLQSRPSRVLTPLNRGIILQKSCHEKS